MIATVVRVGLLRMWHGRTEILLTFVVPIAFFTIFAFIFDEQGDEIVLTGVADVCGHGISSALLMNAFASSINALSMTQVQPGQLLEITNDLLAERVGTTGLFVTAVLMRDFATNMQTRIDAIDKGLSPDQIKTGSAAGGLTIAVRAMRMALARVARRFFLPYQPDRT